MLVTAWTSAARSTCLAAIEPVLEAAEMEVRPVVVITYTVLTHAVAHLQMITKLALGVILEMDHSNLFDMFQTDPLNEFRVVDDSVHLDSYVVFFNPAGAPYQEVGVLLTGERET